MSCTLSWYHILHIFDPSCHTAEGADWGTPWTWTQVRRKAPVEFYRAHETASRSINILKGRPQRVWPSFISNSHIVPSRCPQLMLPPSSSCSKRIRKRGISSLWDAERRTYLTLFSGSSSYSSTRSFLSTNRIGSSSSRCTAMVVITCTSLQSLLRRTTGWKTCPVLRALQSPSRKTHAHK